MVSGLLNTSRHVGGGLVLAILATAASHASRGAGTGLDALAGGYRTAFVLTGVLLLVAALVALTSVPRDLAPATH